MNNEDKDLQQMLDNVEQIAKKALAGVNKEEVLTRYMALRKVVTHAFYEAQSRGGEEA